MSEIAALVYDIEHIQLVTVFFKRFRISSQGNCACVVAAHINDEAVLAGCELFNVELYGRDVQVGIGEVRGDELDAFFGKKLTEIGGAEIADYIQVS